jgi:hypothetical protein
MRRLWRRLYESYLPKERTKEHTNIACYLKLSKGMFEMRHASGIGHYYIACYARVFDHPLGSNHGTTTATQCVCVRMHLRVSV